MNKFKCKMRSPVLTEAELSDRGIAVVGDALGTEFNCNEFC